MESLRKGIRYQFMESKRFLLGLWGTTLIVNIFFYILNTSSSINFNIGFSVGYTEGVVAMSVAGINLMIILISLLVYNYESNYESFPLALSLSMTRKEYFLSFLLDNVFIAFVFASIQGVLLKIDPVFVKLIGKIPLYDFIYFNTKTDNVFFIIFTLFITFLGFISFCNLVSSINYKFGYKMWILIVAVNVLVRIFNMEFIGRAIENIFKIFDSRLGAFQIVAIIVSMVVFYMLNYFVVMRTDVKKKIG